MIKSVHIYFQSNHDPCICAWEGQSYPGDQRHIDSTLCWPGGWKGPYWRPGSSFEGSGELCVCIHVCACICLHACGLHMPSFLLLLKIDFSHNIFWLVSPPSTLSRSAPPPLLFRPTPFLSLTWKQGHLRNSNKNKINRNKLECDKTTNWTKRAKGEA